MSHYDPWIYCSKSLTFQLKREYCTMCSCWEQFRSAVTLDLVANVSLKHWDMKYSLANSGLPSVKITSPVSALCVAVVLTVVPVTLTVDVAAGSTRQKVKNTSRTQDLTTVVGRLNNYLHECWIMPCWARWNCSYRHESLFNDQETRCTS